jgi:MYXO-CTERM domain-containing protein
VDRDGLNITSVEISHAGSSAPNSFVASNGFSIGAVPAPGAMALIGLAGVLARRRRA